MNDTKRLLFDRAALDAHRHRAEDQGLFLHDLAIDLVQERLEEVNRPFTKTGIIGWQAQRWATGLGLDAHLMTAQDILPITEGDDYDLLIHAMEMHWAEDPVGQLIQMRRALKPDGLMITAMFGGRSLQKLRTALAEAEIAQKGGLSPRMSPLADIRDLGDLVQRAGYGLPVADNHLQDIQYSTPLKLMHDLRAMGETNALRDRPKTLTSRAILMDAMARLAADGPLTECFELVFLTGWAPSDTQQKPLKPGSATHSLADFLGKTPKGDPN
ncbi:MAG: SAM-dependent methyltransferase [Pseudomonadota bacterium]